MPQYLYTPLSKDSDKIRLFRLLPSDDDQAEIRGELFEYRLRNSSRTTHAYEALSYVWGVSGEPYHLLIGDDYLDITWNLHAALLRLRDQDFPRIIWIDAICINQTDDVEKAHQIRSMAKIYGRARQVTVWLGEVADKSEDALETIRTAGKQSTNTEIDGETKRAVELLLQRQWFRRIWILQEVAAARRVLIVCGTTEIDGLAFCSGLEQLKTTNRSPQTIHDHIRSILYLIRGANFRSQLILSTSEPFSLEICSMSQLVDMYHAHEATKRHDKVYALLGMATDIASDSGLLPDYGVPWHELLQRLVIFLLGKEVDCKADQGHEIVEIRGKGCFLGRISMTESLSDGTQKVRVEAIRNRMYFDTLSTPILDGRRNTYSTARQQGSADVEWTLHSTTPPVQKDDIVCQLLGSSKPMIIRPHEDHFAVIVVAANAWPISKRRTFSREFLLIWDWSLDLGKSIQSLQSLQDHLGRATALWVTALMWLAIKDEERARSNVSKANRIPDNSPGEGIEAVITQTMLEETEATWDRDTVASLLKRLGKRSQITLEGLLYIMEYFSEEVVGILLNRMGSKIDVTVEVLKSAASNEDPNVITHLLRQREESQWYITEAVLIVAAENERHGEEITEALVDQAKEENVVTQAVIQAAAANRQCGNELMAFLLERKVKTSQLTPAEVLAIIGSFNEDVVQLLLDREGEELQISEEVVKAAAKNRYPKVISRLLDWKGDGIQVTPAVLIAAMENKMNRHKIIEHLIDRKDETVEYTEEVFLEAIRWSSYSLLELLLDRKGHQIQITEKTAWMVVGSDRKDRNSVIRLLEKYKRAEFDNALAQADLVFIRDDILFRQ